MNVNLKKNKDIEAFGEPLYLFYSKHNYLNKQGEESINASAV